jgi:hypothetical protein
MKTCLFLALLLFCLPSAYATDATQAATPPSTHSAKSMAQTAWAWTKSTSHNLYENSKSAAKTGGSWTAEHAELIGGGFKKGGVAFYHAVTGKHDDADDNKAACASKAG